MTITVQHGETTGIAGIDNYVSVDSYGAEANAFIVAHVRSSDTSQIGPQNWQIRAITVSPWNQIRLQNNGSNGVCAWQVVRCDDGEFSVQKINDSFTGTNLTKNHTITAVDLSRTLVLVTERPGGSLTTSQWLQAGAATYAKARLTTTTNVEVTRGASFTGLTNNYTVFVVQFATTLGIAVEQLLIDDAFSGTPEAAALTGDYSTDDTWLYASWSHATNSPAGLSARLAMDFTNDEVDYSRESGVAASSTSKAAVSLLKFDPGVLTLQETATLDPTETSIAITLAEPVNVSKSVIFASVASGAESVNVDFPCHLLTPVFTSITDGFSSEITVTRSLAVESVDVTVYVIDFSGGVPSENQAVNMMMGHPI